jgi:Holliday junction resolvasome RuvABC DNA-binding subunit
VSAVKWRAALALLAQVGVHEVEAVIHADDVAFQLAPAIGVGGKLVVGREVKASS